MNLRAAKRNVNKDFDVYSTRSTRRREQNLQEEKRKLEQAYHHLSYEKNLDNKHENESTNQEKHLVICNRLAYLILRIIEEGKKNNLSKATLLFVDVRKAFDSIHRERMFYILSVGIPLHMAFHQK